MSAASACVSEGTPANAFPEGRDTFALVSEGVLVEGLAGAEAPVPIVALDVAANGRIALADQSGRVTVHEASGTLVKAFYVPAVDEQDAQVSAVALLRGGNVAVREARKGRVIVFERGGGELHSFEATPSRAPYGRNALLAADDGSLFVGVGIDTDPFGEPVPFPREVFLKTDYEGATIDTLFVGPEVVEGCPVLSEGRFRSGWFEDFRSRYIPKPKWTVGRDGTFAYGCPAEYSFSVHRPGADAVSFQRMYRPYGVVPGELRDFQNVWTVQMNTSGAYEEWKWTGPQLPDLKPAYGRLILADGGRTWVWPARPSGATAAPPDWPLAGLPEIIWSEGKEGAFDVFDVDGRLLGHVRLPERVPFTPYADTPDPVIRGDTVWAVTVDPDTRANAIERFRVDWESGPGRQWF